MKLLKLGSGTFCAPKHCQVRSIKFAAKVPKILQAACLSSEPLLAQ